MKEFATPRGQTSPQSYQPEPPRNAPNAALLIDFDNVTMGVRSDLQEQMKAMLNSEVFKGKISVQRAYADWRRYPQYIVPLSEASIDLIFAPAFGSNKKNATDIRLAIDALELVFTRPEIGTYILLSGDSDFSSLVLKLKEYGKFVIGVGIRESSSDLLIQNCDEYYSYSDLTGLLRESDIEIHRRDPWELIVEAVGRMKERDDVMRSDRLKQVMQEIDPEFDEKDAGFSRYSKFLQEAQRRGMLRLSKMDNGQYEIMLGNNASAPPDQERKTARKQDTGGGRGRGRSRDRSREGDDRTGRPPRGLSLADAFGLLRRALDGLGATGDESTDAAQALDEMRRLHGGGDDPILEDKRFQRLLRQAHDAGVIDLVKSGDDDYLLKLRPATGASPADREARSDDRGSRRGRRGGRGRSRRRSDERPDEPAEKPAEAPAAAPADQAGQDAGSEAATRNPRYRKGSRAGAPTEEPAKADEPIPGPVGPVGGMPEVKDVDRTAASEGRRSLGRRTGSRGASRRQPGQADPGFVPGPVGAESGSAASGPAREPATATDASAPARPAEERDRAPAAREEAPAEEAEGGLFRRMTAAFQRAVSGEKESDE